MSSHSIAFCGEIRKYQYFYVEIMFLNFQKNIPRVERKTVVTQTYF